MTVGETGGARLKELSWLAPCLVLGLIALVMERPWPKFPPPAHYRVVIDAKGMQVKVPVPLKGVLSYPPLNDLFLMYSHAPEALYKAGGPKDRKGYGEGLYGRIYPQLVASATVWDMPTDMESLLAAYNDGTVYFWPGWIWGADERLGMIGYYYSTGAVDTVQFTARIVNRLLGHEDRAEPMIAAYETALKDLDNDLKPDTLADWPSAISMWTSDDDWSDLGAHGAGDDRVGLRDAAHAWNTRGRKQEAERVLAMDPDLILLLGGDPKSFLRDPRWRGLKAVRSRRVYAVADFTRGAAFWHMDFVPYVSRWTAEVAHPERLQPRLRGLLRNHFVQSYGYRLSDSQLDAMLSIEANSEAPGYQRFMAAAGRDESRQGGGQ